MEVNNLDKLVKTVTDNILNRMDIKVNSKNINDKSCLILIPNKTFGFTDYFECIAKDYPGYDLYIGSNEEFSDKNYIESKTNIYFVKYDLKNQLFINLLDSVENIIVLGLKINQLKALSELDDKEDINHIILGSLMANKPLNIMINSNELIFNKISKMVNGIRNIGINVVNIQQSNGAILEKIDLITESYVMSLKENGLKNLILNKKQLITPLAKDRLSEYKIKVEYKKEEK